MQERKSDRRGGRDGNGWGRVGWRLLCPTLRYAWLKLWSSTCGGGVGEGGGGEGKVGQGASLICSRKASQIDLSKTMTRLLRNINPHSFNIAPASCNIALQPVTSRRWVLYLLFKYKAAEEKRRTEQREERRFLLQCKSSSVQVECTSPSLFLFFFSL